MTEINISLRKFNSLVFLALSFYSFSLANARIDAIINAPNFLKVVPTMQLLSGELLTVIATISLLVKLLYDFIKNKEYKKDHYDKLISENIISCNK